MPIKYKRARKSSSLYSLYRVLVCIASLIGYEGTPAIHEIIDHIIIPHQNITPLTGQQNGIPATVLDSRPLWYGQANATSTSTSTLLNSTQLY